MSPIGTMPPLDQLYKMIEFHPDPQHYELLTIIGTVLKISVIVWGVH